MAHLLGAENVSMSFGTRTVLDKLSLGLEDGDRIGMVGRNGDGKSTLMRLLAGRMSPDEGRVTKRGDVRVAYLDQTDVLDGALSVGEAIVGRPLTTSGPPTRWCARSWAGWSARLIGTPRSTRSPVVRSAVSRWPSCSSVNMK